MAALAKRLRGHEPARQDGLLALGLLALAQTETWLAAGAEGQRPETAAAAAVMTLAVAWRRRAPLAALLVQVAAFTTLGLVAEVPNAGWVLPTTLITLYSLGAHSTQERGVIGLTAALAGLALSTVNLDDATLTDLTAPALLFTAAWAVGRAIQSRRQRTSQLEDHAVRLEREREERERAAVADERARIARELHDIVAHRVSTIVIQAEAGLAASDEPELIRDSFGAIRDSGRQALGELRRLLGLLREPDDGATVAPQPGLARLGEAVAEARSAGLPVSLEVSGDVHRLPPGVDLAAYRIVQESLTNALRHARTATSVRIARAGGRLQVEVRNPLPPAGAEPYPDGTGHGLTGMRERARIYGGELSAGQVNGEFVVRAGLPVEEPQ